ncbi:hypothetical protein CEN40_21410 [Fischerella thermalis CCMEE 5205]|nr:hypothetical protein CEN40_21410 [Fischerella thermalis CCMEE 5205]
MARSKKEFVGCWWLFVGGCWLLVVGCWWGYYWTPHTPHLPISPPPLIPRGGPEFPITPSPHHPISRTLLPTLLNCLVCSKILLKSSWDRRLT